MAVTHLNWPPRGGTTRMAAQLESIFFEAYGPSSGDRECQVRYCKSAARARDRLAYLDLPHNFDSAQLKKRRFRQVRELLLSGFVALP